MLVVFDNRIGQLLPREVLLGPLLIILILGPVQGLPVLVEHGSLLGQAAGLGVKCGLWSWNDPSLIWSCLHWTPPAPVKHITVWDRVAGVVTIVTGSKTTPV